MFRRWRKEFSVLWVDRERPKERWRHRNDDMREQKRSATAIGFAQPIPPCTSFSTKGTKVPPANSLWSTTSLQPQTSYQILKVWRDKKMYFLFKTQFFHRKMENFSHFVYLKIEIHKMAGEDQRIWLHCVFISGWEISRENSSHQKQHWHLFESPKKWRFEFTLNGNNIIEKKIYNICEGC